MLHGPEMSLEAALRDLGHTDPRVRLQAVDALATAQDPAAVEAAVQAVRPMVSDDHPEVRYAALLALGFLQDEGSIQLLVDAVAGDGYDPAREAAVISLGRLTSQAAFDALLGLARHESPRIRFQAIGSLVELLEHLPGERDRAARAILPLLDDDDPFVRREAVVAVGDLGCREARRSLVALLTTQDQGLRLDAAAALARMGDAAGAEVLAEVLLRDAKALKDQTRATVAARHLFLAPTPEAVPALRRVSGRWLLPPEVKVWTTAALARLGDQEAMERLVGGLRSRRVQVKGLTIQALGELGEGWARAALEAFARTKAAIGWEDEVRDALEVHSRGAPR